MRVREGMNRPSLTTGFERGTKRTAKHQFLKEMLAVMPWDALDAPRAHAGPNGRPPYPLPMLLWVHFLRLWFSLSGEAVHDAVHDV